METVAQKRDNVALTMNLFYHKVRRFMVVHFRIKYVRESIDVREGACDQCGQCCKIIVQCPFLSEADGHTSCRIYKLRPLQCRAFPLHDNDLRDIEYKCSFRFRNTDDA